MKTIAIQPVTVCQFYEVSPEIIFDAWTNPRLARKWLFVGPTSKITAAEIHLDINGKFSILEFDSQAQDTIAHFGEYHVIHRPDWLEFTLSVPRQFPGTTYVALNIERKNGGCELHLMQTGVAPEVTESRWRYMLMNLKTMVEQEKVGFVI